MEILTEENLLEKQLWLELDLPEQVPLYQHAKENRTTEVAGSSSDS